MGSRSCDHPVHATDPWVSQYNPPGGAVSPRGLHPPMHALVETAHIHAISQTSQTPSRATWTCHVDASTWTNLPERLSALHARARTELRPLRETHWRFQRVSQGHVPDSGEAHRRFQNVPRRRPLMSKTYLRFGPMPAKAIS